MLNNDQSDAPMMWSAPVNPQVPAPSAPYTPYLGGPIDAYALAPHENAGEQSWDDLWRSNAVGLPPVSPPVYENVSGDGGSRRRRNALRSAVVMLALLVTLATGIGIGHAASQTAKTTIGAASSPVVSVSTNVTSIESSLQSVASAVTPSVVEITSVASGQEAIGSGDILTSTGYIVTNDHVVDGYTTYTVTLSNGTKLAAQLVGTDPQDDLAVIKVSATNLKPIAFADSSKLTVGEFAVAIGNPYGQRNTATFGTVSGLNRTESESPSGPAAVLTGMVQTSAPIAPGNSGGALVNMQGQLIGIPTLGATTQQTDASGATTTVGFAIASNEVKSVAQQLIQSGKVTTTTQGFLGVQGQDVTAQLANADGLSAQSGVLVVGFANDAAGASPARAGGLQSGDVIIAVNGQSISNSADLATAVASQAPGQVVSVTVARGARQLTLNVTLGQRPANA